MGETAIKLLYDYYYSCKYLFFFHHSIYSYKVQISLKTITEPNMLIVNMTSACHELVCTVFLTLVVNLAIKMFF